MLNIKVTYELKNGTNITYRTFSTGRVPTIQIDNKKIVQNEITILEIKFFE